MSWRVQLLVMIMVAVAALAILTYAAAQGVVSLP